MTRALVLLLVLNSSCALRLGHPVAPGALRAAPPNPACTVLANKSLGWHIAGVVTGGLGSAAASGAGVFSSNEVARDSLIGSAALLSMAGAVANVVGGWYAALYTRCQ